MATNNELAVLYVKIQAKTEELEKQLTSMKNKTEASSKSMLGGFSSITKSIAGIGAAYLAVKGAISAVTSVTDAYIAQSQSVYKIEQAIKTTGGAAGFTSSEIKKMANDLENISGIGDEMSLNDVFAQLLTFTNITGESFKRASTAAADLSSVLGNDLKSQTIQLGKALENPITGVGALSEAGISFTDAQKQMIRGFVDQNDIMSAQNIILSEIEAKYGGQAKAAADAAVGTKQLDAAWVDLKESVGALFGPLLSKWLPEVTKGIKGWTELINGNIKKPFKDTLIEIEKLAKTITSDELVNSTKETRQELEKWNKEQIKINQSTWQQLESKKKGLESDSEAVKKLNEQQKILSISNAQHRGNIQAIQAYGVSIQKSTETWSAQGKTVNEIQNRIKQLQSDIQNLSPTMDARRIKSKISEIEELKGIINFESKITTPKITTPKIEKPEVPNIADMVNEDIKNTNTDEFDLEVADADISKYNKIKETHQDFLNTMSAANDTAYQTRKEILDQELEDRIAAAEGEYDANAIIEEAKAIHDEKMIRLEKERADGMQEIREAELEGAKEVADAMSTIEQGLAAVFGEQSAVYKITAGVQAVIATYLAATKALAEVPFPLNFVAAATVTAAGLANVAKIASAHYGGTFVNGQKVAGYAMGGDFIVPPGYPQDSYPIMVESGERVTVTPRTAVQSQNISLNDERIVSALAAVNRNLINLDRRVTSVEIDGKSLAKVIVKNINEFNQAGYDTSQII